MDTFSIHDASAPLEKADAGWPRDSSSRHRPSRSTFVWVGIIAAVSGLFAAGFSHASPTTTGVVDGIERALLAGVVVLAGSRAGRWTLVLAAAIVTGGAAGWWAVLGGAGLLLTVFMVESHWRSRVAGALTGAVVGLAALHLDVAGPTRTETVVGMVAIAPILVSGYGRSRTRTRRRWRMALGAVAALGMGMVVVAGLVTQSASSDVEGGLSAIRRGVSLAKDGDGAAASASFDRARARFARARDKIGAPWVSATRIVPALGANVAALQTTMRASTELAQSARDTSREVDFDRVQRPEGGVDIELLTTFGDPVQRADSILRRADRVLGGFDSPWLIDSLAQRLSRLSVEVDDLLRETQSASMAMERAPSILGADEPRRYLFLFGSPAELRDLGGHIGNWAEVMVDQGRLELVDVGSPLDLAGPVGGEAKLEGAYPPDLIEMQPVRYPQNWGAYPDFPTVNRLASQLFEERTGRQVDGAVYADPQAFASMLKLSGPIAVSGLPKPFKLTEANAVSFLTKDQYVMFARESDGNKAVEKVIREMFDRLTTSALPGPRSLSELFSPLVRTGRFQFTTDQAEDTPMLERFGLRGAVRRPRDGDVLGVINRNAGPSKIDAYLRRETSVDVEWDPRTGDVASVVTVVLKNEAPAKGLNRTVIGNAAGVAPGTNLTDLALLTHLPLEAALVDGREQASRPLRVNRIWRHTVRVAIPPGASRTVTFTLRGTVDPGPVYRVAVVGQPILHPGTTRIRVEPTTESVVAGPKVRVAGDAGTVALDSGTDSVLTFSLRASR